MKARSYFSMLPFLKQVSLYKAYEKKRKEALKKAKCETFKRYLKEYHNCIYQNVPGSGQKKIDLGKMDEDINKQFS